MQGESTDNYKKKKQPFKVMQGENTDKYKKSKIAIQGNVG